jgi:hypothetical protein
MSRQLGFLALWGHYIAYPLDDKEAFVCDLDTGELQSVAKAAAGSRLDWIRGSGDVVIYTEFVFDKPEDGDVFDASRPGNAPSTPSAPPGAAWTITAYDLKTKTRHVLATDETLADKAQPSLPRPRIDGQWVVWRQAAATEEATRRGEFRVVAFDLAAGTKRTVGTGTGPATVSVVNGTVYFNALDGRDPSHLMLWSAKADGSSSQSVVPGAEDVLLPDVRGRLAVWCTYVARSPHAADSRFTITGLKQPGTLAVELGRSFEAESTGTLAMWFPEWPKGLIVADPEFPDNQIELAPAGDVSGASRSAGEGDLVAWVYAPDLVNNPHRHFLRIDQIVR